METTCEHDGHPPDVYLRDCAARALLELIANKWTALVMGAMDPGPQRFGELRRRVDGISQKVLTQNLRTLERDGLVSRTVFATTPPSVEYALTPLGRSISKYLAKIRTWTEAHIEEIQHARATYDQRDPATPVPV